MQLRLAECHRSCKYQRGFLANLFLSADMDFMNSVTTAGFFEASVWPFILVLAALTVICRGPEKAWFLLTALAIGCGYFLWLIFFGVESLAGVFNQNVFLIVFGCLCIGSTWYTLSWKAAGIALFGLASLIFGGVFLVRDYFEPYTVIEGRVDGVRITGRRNWHYTAKIRNESVYLTRPLYERLKLKPVVRVHVGRGSNYVYQIDYLAD